MTTPDPTSRPEAEPRRFTQRQRDIIDRLERVLYAANKAGIALCGMDDTLYAYRADDFDRLRADLPSAYEVQRALGETSQTLDDHGTYRESGGW